MLGIVQLNYKGLTTLWTRRTIESLKPWTLKTLGKKTNLQLILLLAWNLILREV